MKIKTNELTGPALYWAVGLANNMELSLYGVDPSIRARVPGLNVMAPWKPSFYWNQGGPIIERERILIQPEIGKENSGNAWSAISLTGYVSYGPTPLIAAMRCYVASKLGDEVEIPNELLT